MLALNAADTLQLLTPLETVGIVEAAALAANDAAGNVVPKRQHIQWSGGTLLTMPAIGAGAMAVKLVSVVPGNAARNLPVTNGLLVLSEADTGLPVAIMDAASLTAMRTGAVGALGVRYLTPADVTSIGIVGTGVQGAWQAISACAVRPIREVFAVQRSVAGFAAFQAALAVRVPGVTITPCASATELLARTDVIITATTSRDPVLPDEPRLLAGKHFIAIGSFERHMQELPDSVFRLAGHLVLDSEFARHEVGEAVRSVAQRLLTDADIFPIGELVAGRRRLEVARTTAYKSAGMALYDLYVAQAVYAAARRRNVGQQLAMDVRGPPL
ncbi:MAG TPA: ornithine cyclodeaminase family protein [Steroidobacteraceae bacterium]|jgi:ornithine cyclodeaminase/alanine dehydrogenase-like protein (mu-crystallin family)|nr:ornithine cyclodeaminase family protein [Steroidobacteraceae bacterium]